MAVDRQEVRDQIGRIFARSDVLDACRPDRRDMGTVLRLMRSHGISYAVIADLTGIPHSRLDEYGNGMRQPSLDTHERLANGLNLPDPARIALGLALGAYSGSQP